MSTFIKVNGTWVEAVNFWQKVNGTYVQITEEDALMYLQTHVFMHDSDTAILSIIMPSVIEAETCQCKAYSNGARVTSGVTWSIISGSDYATIDSSTGLLTVSSQADNNTVIVGISYDGATVQKSTTVTYRSGGTTETEIIENEDGSYSEINTTVVDNGDGSSTSSSSTTNYDENGNVTGSSTNETINNSDGSSTSTTTNYDENGDPTSGSTANTDTSGNVNTQDVEYDENGNSTVTGYTINTSDNQNGGEDISGGLDTGFIAFDGRPFTIHMVCNVDPTEQPASGATMFLAALEHNGNKYAGFCVDLYRRNQVVSMASTSGSINNNGFGSRVTGSINGSSGQQLLQYVKTNGGVQTLTIDITYTPASYNPDYKYVIKVTPLYTSATGTSKKTDANSTLSSNSGYLPTSLSNATVVVGSFGVEHTHDMTNLEVLEFEVRKL